MIIVPVTHKYILLQNNKLTEEGFEKVYSLRTSSAGDRSHTTESKVVCIFLNILHIQSFKP